MTSTRYSLYQNFTVEFYKFMITNISYLSLKLACDSCCSTNDPRWYARLEISIFIVTQNGLLRILIKFRIYVITKTNLRNVVDNFGEFIITNILNIWVRWLTLYCGYVNIFFFFFGIGRDFIITFGFQGA